MDPKNQPTVSIGMPIYNGSAYLSVAIEALLAQTYRDFELIIFDNCSTDNSREICREFAAKDSRIQFHESETNVGAAGNFNRVLQLARGRYFMWAAYDDLWEPNYIEKCVAVLDRHPEAVLCAAQVAFIDKNGEEYSPKQLHDIVREHNLLDTRGLDVRQRVRTLLKKTNWYSIYGLIRRDALVKTRGFGQDFGTDVILLLELLLQGESHLLPEKLFRYRVVIKKVEEQMKDITGASGQAKTKPYTDMVRNLLETVEISDLGFGPELKRELTRELLAGLCEDSRSLRHILSKEHPTLRKLPDYALAAELQALFNPGITPAEAQQFRERYYQAYLAKLSGPRKIGHKIARLFTS